MQKLCIATFDRPKEFGKTRKVSLYLTEDGFSTVSRHPLCKSLEVVKAESSELRSLAPLFDSLIFAMLFYVFGWALYGFFVGAL